MNKLQTAHEFLAAAEQQLRDLITLAAAEGDYLAVTKLAEAAEGLRRTTKVLENSEQRQPEPSPIPTAIEPPTKSGLAEAASPASVRRTTKEYPRFERQDDRLIKVGWSKKERAEYEHRTDKDIVSAVSLYLAEAPKEKTFRMDDMLPIEIEGSEVPLYQAYLVLAWLRDRRLIGKQGKDGYQWLVGDFDEPAFEAAWGSTTRRN
jgi:hypothetical protein